jgi:type II secretory pathway pseudopilin PulG
MSRFRKISAGFSMVEVAVALGVVTFALLTVLALLPMGIKSNQISAEETRAVNILSALEADLRNSHPQARPDGRSALFGFDLPYAVDAAGNVGFNTAGITGATTAPGDGVSTGLDEAERCVPLSGGAPYQASVVYTSAAPAAGSPRSLQARLIVNWPARPGASFRELAAPSGGGSVETLVSFPPP